MFLGVVFIIHLNNIDFKKEKESCDFYQNIFVSGWPTSYVHM